MFRKTHRGIRAQVSMIALAGTIAAQTNSGCLLPSDSPLTKACRPSAFGVIGGVRAATQDACPPGLQISPSREFCAGSSTRKTHGGYAPEVVSFYKPVFSDKPSAFLVSWKCPSNTAKDQHVAIELSLAGGPVIAYTETRCLDGELSVPVDLQKNTGRLHAKVELACMQATTLLLATVEIPRRLQQEKKVNVALRSGSEVSLAVMYNETNEAGWALSVGDDVSEPGKTIGEVELRAQAPRSCEPLRVKVARKASKENPWTADLFF